MGFFDFIRRPFRRKEDEARQDCAADQFVNEANLIDQIAKTETQPSSLYGGLCTYIAGKIATAMLDMAMGMWWTMLVEYPRYQYVHDWTGKHRLTWLKYSGTRRRTASYGRIASGRRSLKSLGWRIVSIA